MNAKQLPPATGISLKPQHYQEILDSRPNVSWFEVHPENYMGKGGLPHHFLSMIREHYPLSMHGVGLSLGSADGIDAEHLDALKRVVDQHQPVQVSEHLAWSHWNHIFLNDLLPLPYTEEFLTIVSNNVHQVQDKLKQRILVENPSTYLSFEHSTLSEAVFLSELVKRTGCGLLLDVNNVFVSASNQGYDAYHYIDDYPLEYVGEIHLAGHAENSIDDAIVLIDDHGSKVKEKVWALFGYTLRKYAKPVPVLIEWDTNVPELSTLLSEAEKASDVIQATLKAPCNDC